MTHQGLGLPPGLLQDYAARGVAVWPQAVPAARIAAWRQAVDAVQGRLPGLPADLKAKLVLERDLPPARRDGVPAAEVGDAIFILGEPWAFDPAFERVLAEPAVVAAARALLRTDAVVAHFMNVTVKHPRFGRGIAWHRDFPNGYICTAHADFLRLMLCLDGMDAQSGATRFLPGSHGVSDDEARQASQHGQPGPVAEDSAWTAACAPGDLVAIHPKVLHGGGMNRGARPRRNIVLQVGLAHAALVTQEREAITGRPLG